MPWPAKRKVRTRQRPAVTDQLASRWWGMTNSDPFYYEDESADLAAEMDADRRAERELEMGPEDEWSSS